MTTYIGLLRGVNLGPHKRVAMADLRDLLTGLGYTDVQTLLQSGNAVFRSSAPTAQGLERKLEAECTKRLGVTTDFHVRTAREWQAIVDHNPFLDEAKRDPARLYVLALKSAPGPEAFAALQAAIPGRERVHGDGRHAYIVYPDGAGESKLTSALLDGKLGTRGTGRNWNTVLKIAALASSS